MKTEFIYQNEFEKLNQLKLSLLEYIYWYNNLRIHGFLGYVTPLEYRQLRLASKYQLILNQYVRFQIVQIGVDSPWNFIS